jgi:hypothetical protein
MCTPFDTTYISRKWHESRGRTSPDTCKKAQHLYYHLQAFTPSFALTQLLDPPLQIQSV